MWRNQKQSGRKNFYETALWYLAVLGLAIYIAVKNEEVFAVCVFAVLAVLYIRQNWSYAQHWESQLDAYADFAPETSSTLEIRDDGITECFSNTKVSVAWSEIHDYSLDAERVFVYFLYQRAFIIPFRHLSPIEKDELIETLESYNVRKRP